MWSLESVSIEGFEAQPSLNASLKEFIADLQRVAPFHSGFSCKIKKVGNVYRVHMQIECGTYMIEQKVESEKLFEVLYYAFQASYAKILEQENTKIQALNTNKLAENKKLIS